MTYVQVSTAPPGSDAAGIVNVPPTSQLAAETTEPAGLVQVTPVIIQSAGSVSVIEVAVFGAVMVNTALAAGLAAVVSRVNVGPRPLVPPEKAKLPVPLVVCLTIVTVGRLSLVNRHEPFVPGVTVARAVPAARFDEMTVIDPVVAVHSTAVST